MREVDKIKIRKLYDALKRIASYEPYKKLKKTSQMFYGLEYLETLEMAYENIINEAKQATKGIKRP